MSIGRKLNLRFALPYTVHSASIQLLYSRGIGSGYFLQHQPPCANFNRFTHAANLYTISYRRVPISIPTVYIGRDRFGQLIDSETIDDRVVDEDNQISGVVNNDVEYRDPEYPSLEDTN